MVLNYSGYILAKKKASGGCHSGARNENFYFHYFVIVLLN